MLQVKYINTLDSQRIKCCHVIIIMSKASAAFQNSDSRKGLLDALLTKPNTHLPSKMDTREYGIAVKFDGQEYAPKPIDSVSEVIINNNKGNLFLEDLVSMLLRNRFTINTQTLKEINPWRSISMKLEVN